MLLRNSISNTKRFFQKTLRSFKSLFSGTDAEPYQRLPKASPYNPYSFTAAGVAVNPNDNGNPKERNDNRKKIKFSTHNIEAQRQGNNKGNMKQSTTQGRDDHQDIKQHKTRSAKVGNRREDCNSGERRREERNLSVPQKLKELEMMDMSNMEHVLDIEEKFWDPQILQEESTQAKISISEILIHPFSPMFCVRGFLDSESSCNHIH
ncbi:hypothetical protein ES332_A06G075100v1 [Gossypium tomentosum]|nr:hypothetical protein ES332_A06G075100v1 [Gossypium tomentosum]